MMNITIYHAHLYYSQENVEEARQLRTLVGEKFFIPLGTFHERLVGPHLTWSCQLTVSAGQFADVIPWLALNRGSVDVFVHPVTGNDLDDHTKYIMWLGKSYPLNLSAL